MKKHFQIFTGVTIFTHFKAISQYDKIFIVSTYDYVTGVKKMPHKYSLYAIYCVYF